VGDATSWTYAAGEKGRTRVRVFDRGEKGLYAEWFEPARTPGAPKRRVRRALVHTDRERAKGEVEALALAFRKEEGAPRRGLTLGELFDIYAAEVTPQKGRSKQEHDARARGRNVCPLVRSEPAASHVVAPGLGPVRRGPARGARGDRARDERSRRWRSDHRVRSQVLAGCVRVGGGRR